MVENDSDIAVAADSDVSTVRKLLLRKARLSDVLVMAGAGMGVATIAGFLGRYWWIFDLFSHFRVQYTFILFPLAIALLVLKRRRVGSGVLALAIVNLAVVLPFVGGQPVPPTEVSDSYRVAIVNVLTANPHRKALVQFIRETDPDFFLLEEVSNEWMKDVAELREEYPHVVVQPRPDNFGIALFSRLPLQTAEIVYIGDADVPSVFAQIDLDGKLLSVLGTHPVQPVGKPNSRNRNDQLQKIPQFTAGLENPLVLFGDLNATPWSYHFRTLIKNTGLRDSSRDHGTIATWPTDRFLLRIPIDHFLHSPDVIVLSKKRGPFIGSDHYPLIVDFTF